MWPCLIPEHEALIARMFLLIWCIFPAGQVVMLIQCALAGIETVVLQLVSSKLCYCMEVLLSCLFLQPLSNDMHEDEHLQVPHEQGETKKRPQHRIVSALWRWFAVQNQWLADFWWACEQMQSHKAAWNEHYSARKRCCKTFESNSSLDMQSQKRAQLKMSLIMLVCTVRKTSTSCWQLKLTCVHKCFSAEYS